MTHFVVLDDVALNYEAPDTPVPECIASRFVRTDETAGLQAKDVAEALALLEAAPIDRSALVRAKLLDVEAEEAKASVELPKVEETPITDAVNLFSASVVSLVASAMGSRTPSSDSLGGQSSKHASSNSMSGMLSMSSRHASGSGISGMGSRNPSSSNISGLTRQLSLSRRASRGDMEGLARD